MKLQTSILAKVISSLFPQRLPSRRVIIRLFLLLIAITVTGLYQPSVRFFQPFPRPAIIKQFRYWPEKKKIAQLKNTRENENSSYSVDLYTLCITLKMFKREPTSYFPVFGDTKIQTHVLASFCTRIAQLQDRKRIANRSDYRTKSQESMSINIVIRFSCVNLLIWMPLHSLSVWRQAELPTLK